MTAIWLRVKRGSWGAAGSSCCAAPSMLGEVCIGSLCAAGCRAARHLPCRAVAGEAMGCTAAGWGCVEVVGRDHGEEEDSRCTPRLCRTLTVSQMRARLVKFSVSSSARMRLLVPTLMTCEVERYRSTRLWVPRRGWGGQRELPGAPHAAACAPAWHATIHGLCLLTTILPSAFNADLTKLRSERFIAAAVCCHGNARRLPCKRTAQTARCTVCSCDTLLVRDEARSASCSNTLCKLQCANSRERASSGSLCCPEQSRFGWPAASDNEHKRTSCFTEGSVRQ